MRKRYSMNLGAHMAECDANYARLRVLAPALCAPSDNQSGGQRGFESVSAAEVSDLCEFALDMPGGQVQLVVELVERSRYTTLVRFTQLASDSEPASFDVAGVSINLAPPTMLIRLYHDAQAAEVVEVRNETRFKEVYEYPNPRMRARDEKAQVNRFLGEYLAMCLRYGLAAERVALEEIERLVPGTVLVSLTRAFLHLPEIEALARGGVTTVAMDLVPRTARLHPSS